jgi:hypothetical protein
MHTILRFVLCAVVVVVGVWGSSGGCDPALVYDRICVRDATCRDLFANAGAPRESVLADLRLGLDYYFAMAGRALPFWTAAGVNITGAVYFSADMCLDAIDATAASFVLDASVSRTLDALIRYRAYLQSSACVDPLNSLVYDPYSGIGTCVPGIDVGIRTAATSDDTANALAEGTAITLIVLVAIVPVIGIVLLVRTLRVVEALSPAAAARESRLMDLSNDL